VLGVVAAVVDELADGIVDRGIRPRSRARPRSVER
jgi:hypothetical protein